MNDEQFEGRMQIVEVEVSQLMANQLRARDTAQREALALAESERDRYKAAWMEFMDRTDWMQEKGQVPAKYLGQHRADVLTAMLNEARAALATQPAAGEPKWSCLNAWFLSLEPGRQAVLREEKWMLAGAAFDAGRQCAAPPAAAHGDDGRTCRFCQKRFNSAGECGNHVDQFHHGEAEPAAHGDEAVRKDAARYQALRNTPEIFIGVAEGDDMVFLKSPDQLDQLADNAAAMRAQGDGEVQ